MNCPKNNNIKKIYVCSDILSTNDKEQLSNLVWLCDLLKRPIKNASNIEIETFSGNEKEGFSRKHFFELSNIEIELEPLQIDFNDAEINKNSIKYLKSFIDNNTLLIGYEFSLRTRKLLDKNNIPYIDLWLHPIRFLDDILFGFNSNIKEVFEKIDTYHYSEENYYLYADNYKISTYKGYKRLNHSVKQNSALLVGQTLQDKAVLLNGRFLNLLDFSDRILEISKQYDKVYFSRHPYEKNDGEILEFLKTIPNLEITNIPAYHLLVNDNVKKVFGISSSVVVESKYFDKDFEFLYRPVLNLTSEFSIDSYRTILQELAYSYFWADILSPLIDTNKVEKIEYFNKKDKLRDMLGFYWSYKHIDKTEMMRNTLNAVDKKLNNYIKENNSKQSKKVKKQFPKTILKDEELEWIKIKNKIDNNEIVSFDLFDTLLVRPFENPNDIFDLMSFDVEKITNGSIKKEDFRKLRESSRGLVKNNQGEEVGLDKRYNALIEELELDSSLSDKLLNLELSYEKKYLYVRKYAKKIFNYSLENNKKVIVITDTFYSRDFLNEILDINDFKNIYKIYSSEEIGLLKHTGNMYPYVLEDLNIEPSKIVHIGDNKTSDIENAQNHKLNTIYLPRTISYFKELSGLDKSLSFQDKQSCSVVKGLIGNKVMDNPLKYSFPSHSNGDKYLFGYSMLGPMFFGFAKWLLENAINDKQETLYFLARDGFILKQCYDLVSKDIPNAPKSKYLYASRRSLSVPSIETEEDIIEVSNINFSKIPLKTILFNRFAIDIHNLSITENDIRQFGFNNFDEEINSKDHLEGFQELCLFIKENIFEVSKNERELILEYFKEEGLFNNNKHSIVDIGHNGTLQYRINKLLKTKDIDGYYFITQLGIVDTIYNNGMNAKGFVANEINGSDKRYPYNKYILMFETCFLNEEGSFVNLSKENGKLVFNKLPTENEDIRMKFIKETHSGVLDFIQELLSLKIDINIEGRESINPYLALLKKPFELDVLMFNKVSFENNYSGRDHSYVVYFDKNSRKLSSHKSYWKDWCEEVEFTEDTKNDFYFNFISFLLKNLNSMKILSDKKYNKFLNKPHSFFNDSKNPLFKLLGRFI